MSELDATMFMEWLDCEQHILIAPEGDERSWADLYHEYMKWRDRESVKWRRNGT